MAKDIRTIGIIGAGDVGSQVARLAIKSGYNVVISNSRAPATLAPLVKDQGISLGSAARHGYLFRGP